MRKKVEKNGEIAVNSINNNWALSQEEEKDWRDRVPDHKKRKTRFRHVRIYTKLNTTGIPCRNTKSNYIMVFWVNYSELQKKKQKFSS